MQSKRDDQLPVLVVWHKWFAWHPVSLLGPSRTVWLCWVFRRKTRFTKRPGIYEYTDTPELYPIGPAGSDHWL
jgi:hypothetical protein